MKTNAVIEHPTPKMHLGRNPEILEFARRHKITVPVAAAILANAKTIEDADKAVSRMRG